MDLFVLIFVLFLGAATAIVVILLFCVALAAIQEKD